MNKDTVNFIVERARERLDLVPEHLHRGVMNWLEFAIPPGDFLSAVLRNDLFEAMGRADEQSRAGLFGLVQFFYNYAPSTCYGSLEKMRAWQEAHPATHERAERDAEVSP